MRAVEKVTLSLPKELMDEVREIAPPLGYSKFIAEAIGFFIESKRRLALRERLIVGYQTNAAADLALAAEWAPTEDHTWLTYVPPLDDEEQAYDD